MKLYSAITFGSIDNRENVSFGLYVFDKYRWPENRLDGQNKFRWPEKQMEDCIQDYTSMKPEHQERSKEVLSEYFSEDEVSLLAEYMKKSGRKLHISEESLPIQTCSKDPDGNIDCLYSLAEDAYSSNNIVLSETDKEGYDLPFEVWGRFNPDDGYPSRGKLPKDMLFYGLDFLSEALKRLSPPSKLDEDALIAIVKGIYKDQRLYVNSREYIHP
mgnify:CR=1 FL=1